MLFWRWNRCSWIKNSWLWIIMLTIIKDFYTTLCNLNWKENINEAFLKIKVSTCQVKEQSPKYIHTYSEVKTSLCSPFLYCLLPWIKCAICHTLQLTWVDSRLSAPISFTAHLLEILIYHLFDTSQDNDKMANQSQQSINSPLSSLLSNMFWQIYSLQMKFGWAGSKVCPALRVISSFGSHPEITPLRSPGLVSKPSTWISILCSQVRAPQCWIQ